MAVKAPATAGVGDLVLVGASVWVVTATRRDNNTPASFEVSLIGPPRPNSSLGRVVSTVAESEIAAVFKRA